MKNLSRIISTVWAVVTTAPIWGPLAVAVTILHLIGWADFSENHATVGGEEKHVGFMWTLNVPTEWLPFVESTLQLALGFRFLPVSWGFSITRRSLAGGPFVHAVFGLFDLTFAFLPIYPVTVDA